MIYRQRITQVWSQRWSKSGCYPETYKCFSKQIQVNLIITLSLGSMETDRVIGELCYNEVIYNKHIAK